ncbi:uncharacterized protein V1516DRAFT_683556 [Lipomyces oligophaga]|uniref:uncharacterized protein n=1 Tax=Lipomyces oligophaga TaxID=45792 RepID=UPI0034CE3A62
MVASDTMLFNNSHSLTNEGNQDASLPDQTSARQLGIDLDSDKIDDSKKQIELYASEENVPTGILGIEDKNNCEISKVTPQNDKEGTQVHDMVSNQTDFKQTELHEYLARSDPSILIDTASLKTDSSNDQLEITDYVTDYSITHEASDMTIPTVVDECSQEPTQKISQLSDASVVSHTFETAECIHVPKEVQLEDQVQGQVQVRLPFITQNGLVQPNTDQSQDLTILNGSTEQTHSCSDSTAAVETIDQETISIARKSEEDDVISDYEKGQTINKRANQSCEINDDPFNSVPIEQKKNINHIAARSSSETKRTKKGYIDIKITAEPPVKSIPLTDREAKEDMFRSRIAQKQEQLARIQTEYDSYLEKLKCKDPQQTIKNHIQLLKSYNEIRDIGLGLIGMNMEAEQNIGEAWLGWIADTKGVQLKEALDEYGMSLDD